MRPARAWLSKRWARAQARLARRLAPRPRSLRPGARADQWHPAAEEWRAWREACSCPASGREAPRAGGQRTRDGHRGRIGAVAEQRLAAGGQISERQRVAPMRIAGRGVGGVVGPLVDRCQQGDAFRLGFQHRTSLSVQEQHVVGWAGWRGHLAHGDARPGVQVQLLSALHDPAGSGEHGVDLDAGSRLRRHGGVTRAARSSMRRRSRMGVPGSQMKLSRS